MHHAFYVYLSQGQCNARQRHKRMVTPSILVTDCKYSFLLFATIYSPTLSDGLDSVQCYTSLDIILRFKMLAQWTLLRWAAYTILFCNRCNITLQELNPLQMGWPPAGQASCSPSQVQFASPSKTCPPPCFQLFFLPSVKAPPRSSLPLLSKRSSYTLIYLNFLPSVKVPLGSLPSSPSQTLGLLNPPSYTPHLFFLSSFHMWNVLQRSVPLLLVFFFLLWASCPTSQITVSLLLRQEFFAQTEPLS